MKKERLILSGILFAIGFIGILSLLTMDFPLPEEISKVLLEEFSPQQVKFLILVNPTIMLVTAVLLGVFLHDKVSFDVPIIKGIIRKKKSKQVSSIVQYGIIGGLISGVILTLISIIYHPLLPREFLELGESIKPTLAARFLYGGFTEEIIMRFGLVTFLVWLFFKLFKKLNHKVYWMSIFAAAVIFALGHFPIAFQAVGNPSGLLLSYILIGNVIGGIIFGWLYWKKGLESAFIAHVFTHIIIVIGELLLI